ncbi:GntR family transcriptional regulator [hydrothermal vent metagenome]|uniref:GntR family transcriptional regulator n=1 Tax=hydrothermal vent metagenome TaxID=652676 RepID=A0A3B1E048_9ZZZZ
MASVERLHRLLRLVELLQSGRHYNSSQLASECSVSRRTVFRDLNLLQGSGIPVSYDDERQGYSLPSRMFLPPTDLTLDESLSLLVLCYELGDDAHEIPFHVSARSAAVKLLSNLPGNLREHVGELTEAISVRLEAHTPLPNAKSQYDLLMQAITKRRQIRIQYYSFSEEGEISTVVSPYRILFNRRSWYLIGRSTVHRKVRTFNIGRIVKAELLESNYKIPPRFSLERYLGNAWSLIREPGKSYDVTIRFQKQVAQNVAEVQWHKTQKLVWNDDGTLDFHCTVDGVGEIVWWVLGYGSYAKVIHPPELRNEIKKHLTEMNSIYH